MKSVCIVGAGPAGLVAAKTFLQTGEFAVTVYEKNERVGGIWALDRHSTDGFLSPYTPTNLSRFTVGFSDLDWNSVDFHNDEVEGPQNSMADTMVPPMFPKAWMANEYLETYRRRYIPNGVIHCDREIVRVERLSESWRITITDKERHEETLDFDFLIMASGFFARPRLVQWNVPGLSKAASKLPVKTIHSSTFRDLDDLVPGDRDVNGKKILMLGGGNSSGETAAAVALQLSNAQWCPDSSNRKKYRDCKIIHVTPRPLYPLPPFVEFDAGSYSYVPLDFRLYDFSKRPYDLPSYGGRQPMEVRNVVHGALQTMLGGDLSDISDALVSQKGEGRGSVYVALSESYAEYVRSGMIDVVAGRVTDLQPGHDGCATAIVKHGDYEFKIDDVAAVIYATGYTPSPALDILDDNTKSAVKYDRKSMRLPMILEQWQTMSKDAPAVSFLGFYEGPYWPMMEMQARLTAERWLSGNVAVPRSYEHEEELLQLRQSMEDRGLEVPQYWLGDHLGYLEDIAKELSLKRNDHGFGEREGCSSPARYLSDRTDRGEADAVMGELRQIWHDCTVNGKYVARAAFRALQGPWNISRRIESTMSTYPSGALDGIANFYPRLPTSDNSGKCFDLEYLYIESGTFTLANGSSMTAKRRYVYRYSESDDKLSIWFVKPENDLEVDYLFHVLAFETPAEARKASALLAKADHPCNEDMYWTEYTLPMKGIALQEFWIKHTVRGPNKDYVATTQYNRPNKK